MNKDVLLIYPPSYFPEKETPADDLKSYKIGKTKVGVWPALGLLYIASSLRKEGISVDFIDAFLKDLTLDDVINIIRENKPKVIGVTVTSLQTRAAVQLAERIKKEFGSEIIIGAGGAHISLDPEFVNRFRCFDFGITGEGEITFPKVAKKILNGENINRIYFGEIPVDLDALPLPARDLIKAEDYFQIERPYATIVSMRGCPFNCIFCSRIAVSDKIRYRTPSLVVDEIESLGNEWTDTFVFLDDTFTLKKEHTLNICKEIIKRNLKVKWSCNTRANLLDEELLGWMKKAGCEFILIGVESGDEKFRCNVINKKIKDIDIKNVVKLCKKLKITIGCYLMLGFPGETMEEIKKTVAFAPKFDMDIMSIHITTVYPGSVLYKKKLEKGDAISSQWDDYAKGKINMDEIYLMYIPETLKLEDLQKARKKAYLKFYFRPKIIFKQFLKDIKSFSNLKRDFLTAVSLFKHGKTSKDYK